MTLPLPRLQDGEMLLLGARPGQGKTLFALRLLLDAVQAGRRGVFFTLEYTPAETLARIETLRRTTPAPVAPAPDGEAEIVACDEICASFIVRHLADAPRGALAVVDYLQILDQDRRKPPLAEQISTLRDFARASGIVLVFIAQIDRTYDPARRPTPDMEDLRLPNPLAAGLFSKACFLHEGRMRLRELQAN